MRLLLAVSALFAFTLSSGALACTWDANAVTEQTPLCVAKIETQWQIPTERTDGTPLTPAEIQAFRWYHTPPGGTETFSNLLSTATTHTVDTAVTGEHVFRIATVDSDGVEGPSSPTVTVDVPAGVPYPIFTRVILERCTAANECLRETVYQVQ